MPELLTTDEAAELSAAVRAQALRAGGERRGAVHQGDRQVAVPESGARPLAGRRAGGAAGLAHAPAPPIVGGSHDPLLEWALRESGSELASLPEGSEAGLRRLARGEVTAAAIHLHRLDGRDDDEAPISKRSRTHPGLHDAVVIAFARREQGLVVAAGNPLRLADMAGIAARRARLAQRPQGAGAQLLLLALLARAGLAFDALVSVKPVCPTGPDIAQAVRAGRADCGIATRAVAQAAGLDFVPLDLGAFRPGAAPARLFPAGAAGAVPLRPHGGVPRARNGARRLRRERRGRGPPGQLTPLLRRVPAGCAGAIRRYIARAATSAEGWPSG